MSKVTNLPLRLQSNPNVDGTDSRVRREPKGPGNGGPGMTGIESRLASLEEKVKSLPGKYFVVSSQIAMTIFLSGVFFWSFDKMSEGITYKFEGVSLKVDAINTKFDVVDGKLGLIDDRFDLVDQRLSMVNDQIGIIKSDVKILDSKVDSIGVKLDEVLKRLDK